MVYTEEELGDYNPLLPKMSLKIQKNTDNSKNILTVITLYTNNKNNNI